MQLVKAQRVYKVVPKLLSRHITVMLKPAHIPQVKVTKPVQKQMWPEGASSALNCFKATDWAMFRQAVTYNQPH